MRLRNLVRKFCSCPITTKSTYQHIFQTLSITEITFIFLLESPELKESLSSGQPWGDFQRHRSGLHEQTRTIFFDPCHQGVETGFRALQFHIAANKG